MPGSAISITRACGASRRAAASTEATSGRRDASPGRARTSSTVSPCPARGNASTVSQVKHASGKSGSGGSSVTPMLVASIARTYSACWCLARWGSIRSRSACWDRARRNASLGGRMISRINALCRTWGAAFRQHYSDGADAALARALPGQPRKAHRRHPSRRVPRGRRGARCRRHHASRPS